MISSMNTNKQRGAVSIFVVVFSAMFVTIITISFVSLMIRAQQQAANADLSNSAYDSALAGVEDAKRVLLEYRQCVADGFPPGRCRTLQTIMANPRCDMVRRALTNNTGGETLIQSTSEEGSPGESRSQALDQAYTCVEVGYTAKEKELQIKDGESALVPLDSNRQGYNIVNVSWFTKSVSNPKSLKLPIYSPTLPNLPARGAWMSSASSTETIPPVLRAQFIQHSAQFSSSDFDLDVPRGGSTTANTKTVFLYPTLSGGNISYDINSQDFRTTTGELKSLTPVSCNELSYDEGSYACSVDLLIPNPVNDTGVRAAYLQLNPVYGDTKVKVVLRQGTNVIDMVAPTIDSTGRANDLFRRVKVGISFTGDYPRASFDIGDLCKDFAISSDPQVYADSLIRCDPER